MASSTSFLTSFSISYKDVDKHIRQNEDKNPHCADALTYTSTDQNLKPRFHDKKSKYVKLITKSFVTEFHRISHILHIYEF